uniref:Phospholipid/glycerol acyltransferase domain-containing protein n=1 Tax=Hucho hucho TaxID=62062 RepID=A0A4W5KER2_9TELE
CPMLCDIHMMSSNTELCVFSDRVTLAFTGVGLLVVLTSIIGFLPNGRMKNFLSEQVHLMCYRICVRALTAIITYHNSENKPKNGGICVANHTSPIDVIILASDGCYAMVGQIHGGLMGVIQKSMVKACPHIWFERSEVKDRHLVAKRYLVGTKLKVLLTSFGSCLMSARCVNNKGGCAFTGWFGLSPSKKVYPLVKKKQSLRELYKACSISKQIYTHKKRFLPFMGKNSFRLAGPGFPSGWAYGLPGPPMATLFPSHVKSID